LSIKFKIDQSNGEIKLLTLKRILLLNRNCCCLHSDDRKNNTNLY